MADKSLGAAQRSNDVSPDMMARGIAQHAEGLALFQAELVFGMEGGAAPGVGEDRGHTLVVRDE